MEEILVSINCITYNHEKYVIDAIESFLKQKTTFKFEVIIHDDASLDGTQRIIQDYQKKYPEIIKTIQQNENQYSKGKKMLPFPYAKSSGKYIAICEGDDYWTDPYKLQKQVDFMENNLDCSMCFHASEIVSVDKEKIGVIQPYNKNCISRTEDIILGDGGFMATNSILYRKKIMFEVPYFYLNSPVEDYPLQILTSTENYAYYINDVMSAYRTLSEGSWSSRMISGKDREQKLTDLRKNLIDMLIGFNEYSNGKYSDTINKKILINQFETLRAENKIKQLKSPKYKTIYDSLKTKEKIKINAKSYFPRIFQMLKRLFRKDFDYSS